MAPRRLRRSAVRGRRLGGLAALLLIGLVPSPAAAGAGDAPADAWGLPGELDRRAIEQYLNALDRVALELELEVGGTPGDSSALGAFLLKPGTVLEVAAAFDAADLSAADRAEGPVITELKVGTKSGQVLQLGPLTIKEIHDGQGVVWLGRNGEVCLGLDLEVGWFFKKNFQEELCLESVEQTAGGAVEFNSRRRGLLAKWVVPELRISPEGVVEKKGLPILRWLGGWKPLDKKAKPLPMPLPFHDWPIHLSDLLDWVPVLEDAKGASAAPAAAPAAAPGPAAAPPKKPPPLSALALRFESRMDRGEVTLDEPAATLEFSDHQIQLEIDGRFDGWTLATEPGKKGSLTASWTVAGTVDDESFGRLDISRIRIELGGGLDASLPLDQIEQRRAEVDFEAAIDLALGAVSVQTEEGIAVAMPDGLLGKIRGDGSARLVAGEKTPRIRLSPGSSLGLQIPGPIVLDRPVKEGGPPPTLELPARLHLSAASADKPLLRVDGKAGSGSVGAAAAGSARNVLVLDAGFELAGRGGDEFGLRSPGGVLVEFAAGTGIGLSGAVNAEVGFAGLEHLAGARLAATFELPPDGGELSLRTRKGSEIAGRIGGGGRISLDTGRLSGDDAGTIATRDGWIDADLSLQLGEGGRPSAVAGAARLGLGGGFALRLDPARRQASPRQPLLVGPARVDLSVGLDLAAGLRYRPPDRPAPIVFKQAARFDLGVRGALAPGALGAIEITIAQPFAVDVEMKPR